MGESQRQTKEKFRYFFPSFVENVDRLERSACMIKITVDANSSSIEIFVRTRLVPTSGRYQSGTITIGSKVLDKFYLIDLIQT